MGLNGNRRYFPVQGMFHQVGALISATISPSSWAVTTACIEPRGRPQLHYGRRRVALFGTRREVTETIMVRRRTGSVLCVIGIVSSIRDQLPTSCFACLLPCMCFALACCLAVSVGTWLAQTKLQHDVRCEWSCVESLPDQL